MMSVKKNIILISTGFICLICGVLIGKYEVFPYEIIKSVQDRFRTHKPIKQIVEENRIQPQISPESLISVSIRNIDSLRAELNTILFGTAGLPTNLPNTIYEVTDENYADIVGLKKIKQFEIVQNIRIMFSFNL